MLSRRDFGDDESRTWVAGKEKARRSRTTRSEVGVIMTGGTTGTRAGREAVRRRGFLGSCTQAERGVVDAIVWALGVVLFRSPCRHSSEQYGVRASSCDVNFNLPVREITHCSLGARQAPVDIHTHVHFGDLRKSESDLKESRNCGADRYEQDLPSYEYPSTLQRQVGSDREARLLCGIAVHAEDGRFPHSFCGLRDEGRARRNSRRAASTYRFCRQR